MVEESEITIEMEPVEVPEDWIIQPSLPQGPSPEVSEDAIIGLGPVVIELEPLEPISPPKEHEIIVNLETTDANPYAGRLVSIGYIDTSVIAPQVIVMIDDDEERLVNEFLDWFDMQNFTRLVGFKVTFDHRFLFAKAALYRRPCEKWAAIAQRDIKQILDQVQEGYVYFPSKTGTLDDWGKHLLGYGKLAEQEEFLKRYLKQDWDFVQAFSERQVLLTYYMYALLRYTLGESYAEVPVKAPITVTGEGSTASASNITPPYEKICKVCYQGNPPSALNCKVCGAVL